MYNPPFLTLWRLCIQDLQLQGASVTLSHVYLKRGSYNFLKNILLCGSILVINVTSSNLQAIGLMHLSQSNPYVYYLQEVDDHKKQSLTASLLPNAVPHCCSEHTFPEHNRLSTLGPADTPRNCSFLDGDDFAQFVYDAYNINSRRGVYLTAGNYRVCLHNLVFPYQRRVQHRDNIACCRYTCELLCLGRWWLCSVCVWCIQRQFRKRSLFECWEL